MTFIVQYADDKYYRDGGRLPRQHLHNATKMTSSKAKAIAAATNGKVLPYQLTKQAYWGIINPFAKQTGE